MTTANARIGLSLEAFRKKTPDCQRDSPYLRKMAIKKVARKERAAERRKKLKINAHQMPLNAVEHLLEGELQLLHTRTNVLRILCTSTKMLTVVCDCR